MSEKVPIVGQERLEDVAIELRPLRSQVLAVERPKGKTEGGLVLPETAWGSARLAPYRVIAVGPDVTNLKTGDCIVPEAGQCSMLKYAGHSFVLIAEDHVLAVSTRAVVGNDEVIAQDELRGKLRTTGSNGNTYYE
jgi:co-chaperonin GroES (HSP10)